MDNREVVERATDMVEGLLSSGLDAFEVGAVMVHALTYLISRPGTPSEVWRILAELKR